MEAKGGKKVQSEPGVDPTSEKKTEDKKYRKKSTKEKERGTSHLWQARFECIDREV